MGGQSRAARSAVRRAHERLEVALRLEQATGATTEEYARAVIESACEPGLGDGFGCRVRREPIRVRQFVPAPPERETRRRRRRRNLSGDVCPLSGILEAIERPDARVAAAQRVSKWTDAPAGGRHGSQAGDDDASMPRPMTTVHLPSRLGDPSRSWPPRRRRGSRLMRTRSCRLHGSGSR